MKMVGRFIMMKMEGSGASQMSILLKELVALSKPRNTLWVGLPHYKLTLPVVNYSMVMAMGCLTLSLL
jgi:hypothetical protein